MSYELKGRTSKTSPGYDSIFDLACAIEQYYMIYQGIHNHVTKFLNVVDIIERPDV